MSNLANNTAELTKILAAVNALPEAGEGGGDSGDNPVLVGLTVDVNGVYLASDDGADGYSVVTVNVPSKEPVLREGSATPTKSQQTINPPSGVDGFSTFVVDKIPDEYVVPAGDIEYKENGLFPVSGYANVLIDVPDIPAAVRPLEITENGTHSAADEGLDGYSVVTVNVPSEDLDPEISEQAAKIDQLLTILDSKAAGGGSAALETCTLTVDLTEVSESDETFGGDELTYDHKIAYMKVVDGAPVYCYEALEGHKTYEIANCLKNSIVVFELEERGLMGDSERIEAEGDAEFLTSDPGYFMTLLAITGDATIRTSVY